jgi:hypothetical protein
MGSEFPTVGVVVLDDTVAVRDVFAALAGLGWHLSLDLPPGHAEARLVRWTPSHCLQPDGPLVYLREHSETGIRALVVTDDDQNLVGKLAAALPHENEESLLAAATTADDPLTLIRALHRLATLAMPVFDYFEWREPDPRYLAVWRRLLAHPDTTVRRVAIHKTPSLPWREIDDMLRERQGVERELTRSLDWVIANRQTVTARYIWHWRPTRQQPVALAATPSVPSCRPSSNT